MASGRQTPEWRTKGCKRNSLQPLIYLAPRDGNKLDAQVVVPYAFYLSARPTVPPNVPPVVLSATNRIGAGQDGPCFGWHRTYSDIKVRSDLKPARSSSVKSFGCSQAGKCPPLSSLL